MASYILIPHLPDDDAQIHREIANALYTRPSTWTIAHARPVLRDRGDVVILWQVALLDQPSSRNWLHLETGSGSNHKLEWPLQIDVSIQRALPWAGLHVLLLQEILVSPIRWSNPRPDMRQGHPSYGAISSVAISGIVCLFFLILQHHHLLHSLFHQPFHPSCIREYLDVGLHHLTSDHRLMVKSSCA